MSNAPHYHGHRQRLRERFLSAPSGMADYEILELLLTYILPRRDTKPIAKAMLTRLGSMADVLAAQPEDLRRIEGLGQGAELFWKLLQECRARADQQPHKARIPLSHPSVVANMAISRLGALKTEEFWVALVDAKLRLISWEQVSKGTVGHAPVYVREVLKLALERQAYGIFLVHNHPGGDPRPSREDIDLTQELRQGAQAVGLQVLDHLIVTQQDYLSLQQEGLL
ncbi:JAB domain-containing protein [Megalodesulfovibrio paquesii]